MKQIVNSPNSLGKAIQWQRKAKKMTQEEAGRILKIHRTTLSSVEKGAEGTHVETLFRILAVLGLEMVVQSKEEVDSQQQEDW